MPVEQGNNTWGIVNESVVKGTGSKKHKNT